MPTRFANQPEIFWVSAAAGAVMCLAVVAPWARAGVLASATGIERDVGPIYLLIGAGAVACLFGFANTQARSFLALMGLAGLAGFAMATLDARQLQDDDGPALFGRQIDIVEVGWGLRAYQFAALATVGLAIGFFRRSAP